MNLFLFLVVAAQSLTDGSDPIRRYTPADYNAAFQNWGMVQDAHGRLFSANTAGVLMYDGAGWELYPLPGNRIVRSIGIDSTGRVWIGAENMIGHLEPDLEHGFRFVTDLDSVSGDVWAIQSTATSTWFQASDDIISWQDGRFESRSIRTGAQKAMWNVDGRILIQEIGVGWFMMNGTVRTPIPELRPFVNIRVVSFIPEADGAWIIVTRLNGLYTMEPDLKTLNRLPLDLPEIVSAIRLNDGSLGIGTVRNGIQVISSDLNVVSRPGQEIGVHLDAIWAMMEDKEGHLWLGTDRGLVQMYRYPDLDVWDARSGLIGNIQAIRRFRDRLVIGTSIGMYVQTDDGFQPIEAVNQAVWDLLQIGDELWVATAEGIRIWNGSGIRSIGPRVPTFSLHKDVRQSGVIWVGVAGGLTRIQPSGVFLPVPGGLLDVRNMVQTPDGTLWAGTSRGGVVRVSTDLSVTTFLNSVADTRVALHRSGVLAGTAEGIRRWDEASAMFIPWEASSEAGVYRMVAESPESIWVVRYRNSESWLENMSGGNTLRDPFRRLPNRGLIRIFVENDWIWIGTTSGLFRMNRSQLRPTPGLYHMVLHSVATGNATRIRFAAPWFEDPESVRYRFRLIGDTDWTDWDTDTEAFFLGLWEGQYQFEAEAVNKYGVVSRLEPIEFRIYPPWFRTSMAYFIMVLIVAGSLYGVVYGTQRYSRIKTHRLEKLVQGRTRQVYRQKEELIRSNQSLTSLIDQKNTILGIAAHDLKNPLATIQGFLELLTHALAEEDDLNQVRQELAEQLGYISTASNDMLQIIRDLLELAISQKGEVMMHLTAFSLTDMVYTISNSYRAVAKKKDIRLIAELPSESMVAFADSDRIQEVILNLVSNAVKYTRLGGQVTVTMDRENKNGTDWVGVRIRDEGPGFTEADRLKMFGLFTKLSASPTADERSNGIGLYIVKEFTDRNGGRLDLSTELGVGSLITVWLPVA